MTNGSNFETNPVGTAKELAEMKKLVKLSVAVIEELMPGIKHIVCDIGRLNEYLIEAEKVKIDGT